MGKYEIALGLASCPAVREPRGFTRNDNEIVLELDQDKPLKRKQIALVFLLLRGAFIIDILEEDIVCEVPTQ